jgi:hypothetical protein
MKQDVIFDQKISPKTKVSSLKNSFQKPIGRLISNLYFCRRLTAIFQFS